MEFFEKEREGIQFKKYSRCYFCSKKIKGNDITWKKISFTPRTFCSDCIEEVP